MALPLSKEWRERIAEKEVTCECCGFVDPVTIGTVLYETGERRSPTGMVSLCEGCRYVFDWTMKRNRN